MSYIILGILFMLSGFLMKFSDDLYDENKNLTFACITGILCAVASALASIYNTDAAHIFLGILIGTFLAFKIDAIHHIITIIFFIAILLICGIPDLNYVVLLICVLAALSDEVGHELISKFTQNKFLNIFFEYRFVMKIVILLLAGFGAFNIWIFVCFILFEFAYEFIGNFFKNFELKKRS